MSRWFMEQNYGNCAKNCSKTSRDAAQAPHDYHYLMKYNQCIVWVHLLKFVEHWCDVNLPESFALQVCVTLSRKSCSMCLIQASQRISRSPAKMYESLHYWACMPRPSELEWKRKIMANPPCGKRRSRGAELKTVKPEKHVKQHPNEPLTVSNGSKSFFCRGIQAQWALSSA